jgi:hypothetical protein
LLEIGHKPLDMHTHIAYTEYIPIDEYEK